ncbi:MAG: glycosyl hydrolase [Ginsengibacter sp.]
MDKGKIYTAAKRIGLLLVAVIIGSVLFLLLTLAGKKNKGPLDDLLSTANLNFSRMEKNILDKNRGTRLDSLQWFFKYRSSKTMFSTLDTILLGAYDDNTVESYEPIIGLEDSLQTRFPIISIYTAWGSKSNEVFPSLRVQAINNLGSIPMITWEPWLDDFDPEKFPVVAGKTNKNKEGMKEIAEGRFDEYIDKWADAASQFGAPFYLRFGHEMNDPYRYPWGPQNNKPEEYVAAWRHVYDRFKIKGATNVIWLWSPHPAYITYPQFYPGDEFVDWIGVTAINYGTVATWSQWWSFDDIFGKFYDSVSLYKKPMIITEFGSLAIGGNRAKWFTNAMDSLPQKYPAVKAVVFYHATKDNTSTYKSLDWSFEDDSLTRTAIKQSIRNWTK